MRLLLLEDDNATRRHVARALTNAGYFVDICTTGHDAVSMALSGDYSVLVFDRMVAGLDGLSALRQLRAAGMSTPTILLTAMDGVRDRVAGLNSGADDYLVKPFAASELIARIQALARRPASIESVTVLRVADLEMDLIRRTVTRGERRIDLQPQESKLLEYMLRHKGETVTRTMMLENVWSLHFDPQTNLIESHMSRLRAKIDHKQDIALIHTIRGAGYRIGVPSCG